MSRRPIDAATEITAAWISATGASATAIEPKAVAQMFEAVYKKAEELNVPPKLESGHINF